MSPDTKRDPQSDVDLTNCDREPIHIPGRVQSYGALIACSADWMITYVSASIEDHLGIDPHGAIGARLLDFLPHQTIHDLRSRLQFLSNVVDTAQLYGYDVMGDGRLFDISVHATGRTYVFEFERHSADDGRNELALVQPFVARLRSKTTLAQIMTEGVRILHAMSGFDRVMLYKFLPDGSGEVVAERHHSNMQPFLGLRYPASDIPRQARELYRINPLRLIADVDDAGSEIMPTLSPEGMPLDLSLAATRAVSPIHLEYLRNMGVGASMSVSILHEGKLWGLFACHNEAPHYVDYRRRSAITLFSQFFSYELALKHEAEMRSVDQKSRSLHDRLMVSLSGGGNFADDFEIVSEELRDIITNDGFVVYTEGRFLARGDTPSQTEFMGLARFLNRAASSSVYARDNLSAVYPPAEDFMERAAGLLAIPISRAPRDYIVFFRREIAKSVTWAGNPDKPVETGPNGIRLTPRKSFEAYKEIVRGSCNPWSERDLRTGESLRISLIEVVLKLADEASSERLRANEKQEILIAELNHRVRNILNLIHGLISQSRVGATRIEDFTRILEGRVQALSRANDQLTRQDWDNVSLRDMILIEARAFLSERVHRINIRGDYPTLAPEACATAALVLHELITNSAKYGALVDHAGYVTIDLRIAEDGSLLMTWREEGGPPVQAPTRRGFGTTIIERTIPHELGGKVSQVFKPGGVEVDIFIPSNHVGVAEHHETAEAVAAPASAASPELEGDVLVLEDNMIIALDISDRLQDMGADNVHLVSSVAEALAVLERHQISFAVLDVNLGQQTSISVARELDSRGTPFLLATGYGDVQSIVSGFPPSEVLSKPFTRETLARAVSLALTRES